MIEFLKMARPIASGVATGKWASFDDNTAFPEFPGTKAGLLKSWDEDTVALNRIWSTIPPHRFAEVDTAFGMWTGTGIWMILYAINNETHYRAQGYVYLRAMGIEPPPFYERS